MEDILAAVKTCFRKYVDFSGRAPRPEFWWFFLVQIVALGIAGMLGKFVYGVVALGLLLPGLAVGARRLHDIGKSAWFLLIGLIPFIGFLVLLYFFVQPSGPSNEFGSIEGSTAPDVPAIAPGQQ